MSLDIGTFSLSVRDNITLRFIRPDEAEALYALVDRNRVYLREWLPWVDAQTGPEVSRENIQKRIANAQEGEMYDFGLYDGDTLIGSMGLIRISKANKSGKIGYWLSNEHQGKGLVTDAVRALVSFGFKKFGFHRIEIRCSPQNKKSAAVPERLGFKFEGILRETSLIYDRFEDSNVYSVLEGEWTT